MQQHENQRGCQQPGIERQTGRALLPRLAGLQARDAGKEVIAVGAVRAHLGIPSAAQYGKAGECVAIEPGHVQAALLIALIAEGPLDRRSAQAAHSEHESRNPALGETTGGGMHLRRVIRFAVADYDDGAGSGR